MLGKQVAHQGTVNLRRINQSMTVFVLVVSRWFFLKLRALFSFRFASSRTPKKQLSHREVPEEVQYIGVYSEQLDMGSGFLEV